MEDALVQSSKSSKFYYFRVLILVLMEDALVRYVHLWLKSRQTLVLILVLMEDALVLFKLFLLFS